MKFVSNLVMKVMIVKELMTGDVSPVAMFHLYAYLKTEILCSSKGHQVRLRYPRQYTDEAVPAS